MNDYYQTEFQKTETPNIGIQNGRNSNMSFGTQSIDTLNPDLGKGTNFFFYLFMVFFYYYFKFFTFNLYIFIYLSFDLFE